MNSKKGSASVLVLIIGILAIAGWLYFHNSRTPSKPSAQEITPLLEKFLTTSNSKCDGSATVNRLSDISVGDYVKQLEGWPVYASHQETCTLISSTTNYQTTFTYNGLDDAAKKSAAAYVHYENGNLSLYIPQIFKQFLNQ